MTAHSEHVSARSYLRSRHHPLLLPPAGHTPKGLPLQKVLQFSHDLITAITDLHHHSLHGIDLDPSKLLLDHHHDDQDHKQGDGQDHKQADVDQDFDHDDVLLVADFGLRRLLAQHLQPPAAGAAVTSAAGHAAGKYM